jgi:hypothetical protein
VDEGSKEKRKESQANRRDGSCPISMLRLTDLGWEAQKTIFRLSTICPRPSLGSEPGSRTKPALTPYSVTARRHDQDG